ncbi:restriction endonuclease subunit S [Rhizobium sp. AQ_MP]|uniref:restriction endonuclease subunit S n=1 Tax=Rhizobium sp. AQ_MP TaxID=2761536 RepID=UPI00163B4EDA|nr:restriction endonuclease subunit S [Rhizobium sp. AQ_MP]MBC2775138.1 restriction endonuclease subunit S [Rhizobium sp. AQ_MP]
MSGLPRGWVEATLEDLCEFNPKHDPETDRGTRVSFIPMPAVDDETGAIVDRSAIRPLSEVWKGYTHFADADVIFAKITPCMENGKIAVARDLENGMACGSTEFHVLRSKGAVEPDFIWRFLRQRSYRQVAERSMTGAVGQRRVPKPFLEGTTLPLPPLAEQKRIVAKLDALNAKSARARTELARIETLVSRYKQAVLSKAFSGELTRAWRESSGVALSASEKLAVAKALQRALSSRRGARTNTHQVEFNAVPAIPGSWAHAVIGVGADMTVGFAFKSEWFRVDGVKLLRGANIAPKAIDWSELKCLDALRAQEFARYLVEENDIVLAMDRPVISTGLKVARVAKQDAGCLLVQRVTRFRASEFIAQDFLWWFLNSQVFLAHSLHRATGSDLPHISGDDIATCPLPVPPLEEQHEIVRRIESAFAKIDRLAKEAKRALELVGRLDDAILAKAFRGELVPQDENDEPAKHLLARIRAEREAAPKGKRGRGAKA